MADAPNELPLFYKDLLPVSSKDHAKWKARPRDTVKFVGGQNAIPLTTDEFVQASRYYPIVFSGGETPVPLALMGLNEGINIAIDDDGKLRDPVYVPAYIRRYPFLLARLNPDVDNLSLCFDPTSDVVGKFKDGEALFENGEPSDTLNNIMQFCEQFEQAGARTQSFIKDMQESDLLMDGEVSIQSTTAKNPFIYRGFKMVDEQKLRDLRGDTLRKMSQNGMLPLIYAHLFSLQLMRDIFSQQVAQGKMPQVTEAPQPEGV